MAGRIESLLTDERTIASSVGEAHVRCGRLASWTAHDIRKFRHRALNTRPMRRAPTVAEGSVVAIP